MTDKREDSARKPVDQNEELASVDSVEKKPLVEKFQDWVSTPGDTWTMLTWVLVASLGAGAVSIAYGYSYSLQGAYLSLLASLSGYAVGGILGFLFGFPRYSDAAAVQSIEDLKMALASGEKKDAERVPRIRHSTNLERITDWLMTMIVGATVVNLKDLSGWAETQFTVLGTAIIQSSADPGPLEATSAAASGALIIVPFLIFGFLHLYLWARRYLPREWQHADDELYGKKVQELAVRQKEQQKEISKLRTKLYRVDPSVLKKFQEVAQRFEADPIAVDMVLQRYKAARKWDDDPMKGFGPGAADGIRMSAVVTATGDPEYPYTANITIEREDGQNLDAAIFMLYHNSFDTAVESEVVVDQPKFLDQIWCSDGFTVGALVVVQTAEGPTRTIRLALDLESLPNLPDGFKTTPEKK